MQALDIRDAGCDVLAASVRTSFGPLPREKLLLTATRKAILTCNGSTILSALVSTHPLQSHVLKAALAQSSITGDGSKAVVIMLHAALDELDRQLFRLPWYRRASWRGRIGRAVRWLQRVRSHSSMRLAVGRMRESLRARKRARA